jgi:hypothetical protein
MLLISGLDSGFDFWLMIKMPRGDSLLPVAEGTSLDGVSHGGRLPGYRVSHHVKREGGINL